MVNGEFVVWRGIRMTGELTPDRQKSVLAYLRFYQQKHGIAPTVREICVHLGLRSPAGVHKILHRLIEKKILRSLPGKNRSWQLMAGSAGKSMPVFGSIAAGAPIEAIGDCQEELPLDPVLFGSESCFALPVKGDSMIEAHIMDGDLAIILPRTTVISGGIAAVLVEDLFVEATLKIFRRKKDRIELHAANSAHAPLVFEGKDMARVSIVGKLAGVIRRVG
jgi:repressor LexA